MVSHPQNLKVSNKGVVSGDILVEMCRWENNRHTRTSLNWQRRLCLCSQPIMGVRVDVLPSRP